MIASSAQACMSDFTATLLRRDIDAALRLLADDVVFFYSNGAVLRGKADFAALMTSSWALVEDYRYASANPTWIVESETVAVAVYGFEWSGRARGQPVNGHGRATRVFRDTGSGWLLAHEHLSAGEAP